MCSIKATRKYSTGDSSARWAAIQRALASIWLFGQCRFRQELLAIRVAPQRSHVLVCPPKAAVRQAAMARRVRCSPRNRRWAWRYAAP
jgi:hypothetical protein